MPVRFFKYGLVTELLKETCKGGLILTILAAYVPGNLNFKKNHLKTTGIGTWFTLFRGTKSVFFSQSVLCFSHARIQIRKYSGTKQTINFKWPNKYVSDGVYCKKGVKHTIGGRYNSKYSIFQYQYSVSVWMPMISDLPMKVIM